MIERIFLIIWAVWLALVLIAAFRVLGYLIAKKFQDRRWGDGSEDQRRVAVIIPVKGFDYQTTPRFFNTLFDQNYSDYRVIVCFESWGDPVAVWLKDELELTEDYAHWTHPDPEASLKSITLVCAGIAQQEGQKVHNQRAAFEYLDSEDSIVAFADADISFKSDWLARLVAPVNQRTHPLSTTYRWLVPKRPTLPNQIASVINGSITTQGGSELTNVLWGGSMAISKSVFDKLDVPNLFEGSLNDDLRLSKAARKAGNRIAFVRSLVLPTMIDFNWKSFLEFAKRQYTQVKFFSPILYTGTNIVLGIYAIGLLSVIVALVHGVHFYAWVPLAAAYIIDQFRAMFRQQIYLSLFPEDGIRRKLFSAGWLEHMLTPIWMMLHWLILVSTWTQSKITWAGTQYRILSKSKTRILSREVSAERLPVGAPGLALISSLHDQRIDTAAITPVRRSEHAPPTTANTERSEESAPESVSPEMPHAAITDSPADDIDSIDNLVDEIRGGNAPATAQTADEDVPATDGPDASVSATADSATDGTDESDENTSAAPAPEPSFPVSHPGVSPRVIPLGVAIPHAGKRKAKTRSKTAKERTRGLPRKAHGSLRTRVKPPRFYEPAQIASPGKSLPTSGSTTSAPDKSPESSAASLPEKPAADAAPNSDLKTGINPFLPPRSSAAKRTVSVGKGGNRGSAGRKGRPAPVSRPNQVGRIMRGSRKKRASGTGPSARP
ncbi:MAG: hypothetical protein MI807_19760 [Verrucomicrobiales bacterium]|nr:hypothetical protein [Verrucomicrobiales bacterium]